MSDTSCHRCEKRAEYRGVTLADFQNEGYDAPETRTCGEHRSIFHIDFGRIQLSELDRKGIMKIYTREQWANRMAVGLEVRDWMDDEEALRVMAHHAGMAVRHGLREVLEGRRRIPHFQDVVDLQVRNIDSGIFGYWVIDAQTGWINSERGGGIAKALEEGREVYHHREMKVVFSGGEDYIDTKIENVWVIR